MDGMQRMGRMMREIHPKSHIFITIHFEKLGIGNSYIVHFIVDDVMNTFLLSTFDVRRDEIVICNN